MPGSASSPRVPRWRSAWGWRRRRSGLGSGWSQAVLVVNGDPVRRDGALRLLELQGAPADLLVQEVLHRIFLMGIAGPRPWLWPEIGDVVRCAAQLQRHEMIQLILAQPLA